MTMTSESVLMGFISFLFVYIFITLLINFMIRYDMLGI
jgi:hypothetical protein